MTPIDASPEFEGRPLPVGADLDTLATRLLGADRPWLVRAAVVHDPLARALLDAAELMLDGDADHRSAGLALARALMGRRLVPAVLDRLGSAGWLGIPDPADPTSTLAQQGLRFALDAVGARRLGPTLRWAMTAPELRTIAWRAQSSGDPTAALPHLADLLTDAPDLAGEVATRFALVHTTRCNEACQAIADLPEPTRRAFAEALEKHLRRIFAIRRWAECRRILFGR